MRAFSGMMLAATLWMLPLDVRAEDAYYSIPLRNLAITEGTWPSDAKDLGWRAHHYRRALAPRVALDETGEVYVVWERGEFHPWMSRDQMLDGGRVHIKAPRGKELTGKLFVPNADWTGQVVLKFRVPETASPDERLAFLNAKQLHYEQYLSQGVPGGAWFRHQERLVRRERNPNDAGRLPDTAITRPQEGSPDDLARTYALFSGGRAMSENLQLDRVLLQRGGQGAPEDIETVPLDTIEGITVKDLDWKQLLGDAQPERDPLAAKIPADQHVMFFPSYEAASKIAQEAGNHGTPVLHLAEPRSEDAKTLARYERQLGISLGGASRLFGPALVDSIALTGSDAYYRTGTDVAVLMEAKNPSVLAGLVLAQVAAVAPVAGKAEPVQGEVAGLAYQGRRSPDRSVSSYVAVLDGAVVVTNSLEQLKRLASVAKGETPSIATLPEYKFFRNRYPRADADETALLFLSDATIRRWCGPRWRIATSRRVRDIAVLAEMQASQLDPLVRGNIEPGPLHTDLPIADGAKLTLDRSGVISSVHGTLNFMTPIVEIPLNSVTKNEADAYARWRDGYQRNWTIGFDPIALRVSMKKGSLEADLSVMPLIVGTRYREFIAISRGGAMTPDAGDPHDALVQVALAIDQQSPMFQQAGNIASSFVKGVSLGWLGPAVTVYADHDPFWKELAEVPQKNRWKFLETDGYRAPVALHAEVSSGFKLTAFLAGLRAFVEQSAPGMTVWEPLVYKDEDYVKVSPSEKAKSRSREFNHWAIYYAASGDALIVTPNEKLLHRALDRQRARRQTQAAGKPVEPPARPWLGANLALDVDRSLLDVLANVATDQYQQAMQIRAWSNLPILNEWRRLYPDQDPVKLHERVWGIRLVCPGGGEYVWNDSCRTMESTVYGHPGQPKLGPAAPPVLSTFSHAGFGISFQDDGLRARVRLEREK